MEVGIERACLRSILAARCAGGAAEDLAVLRRIGDLPADHLLVTEVLLQSEREPILEVADELERMMAGGEA